MTFVQKDLEVCTDHDLCSVKGSFKLFAPHMKWPFHNKKITKS